MYHYCDKQSMLNSRKEDKMLCTSVNLYIYDAKNNLSITGRGDFWSNASTIQALRLLALTLQ